MRCVANTLQAPVSPAERPDLAQSSCSPAPPEILDDYPAVPGNPAWLEKYGETIDARFGSAVKFAERFSVPVRIHLTRVRGF